MDSLAEIDARLARLTDARRQAPESVRRLWDEKIDQELDRRLRAGEAGGEATLHRGRLPDGDRPHPLPRA